MTKEDIIKLNLSGKIEKALVDLLEQTEAGAAAPKYFKENRNVNTSATGATYVLQNELVPLVAGKYKVLMKCCISNFDPSLNFTPRMSFDWEENISSPVTRGGLQLEANTPSVDPEFTFEFILNITEDSAGYELTYFVAPDNGRATYIFRYASIEIERVGDAEVAI